MQVNSMKTIKEISVERSIDRSTLLKAAQRGAFGEAARKSGDTWLIDDTSEWFKAWYTGSGIGRPRTIKVETPEPPVWVNTRAGRYAWKVNLNWRVNASRTADIDTVARKMLLREADTLYNQ